jgi:hypothetical protein
LVGAFILAGCGGGGGGTQSPAAAPGSTTTPGAATPAATEPTATVVASQPALGGITDPAKLISSDEAATVLGGAITKTAPNIMDLYAGPLNSIRFSVGTTASVDVGIITPATAGTACAPAMPSCPSWDEIKAKQPGGATAIAGVGDDAFFAKQGPTLFLVGARKGSTEVFLFAQGKVTDATLEAMKTLIASAIGRV